MDNFLVSTDELADAFDVTPRQIQRLTAAGVLEPEEGTGSRQRGYQFDLRTVVIQYSQFLLARSCGAGNMDTWTADVDV